MEIFETPRNWPPITRRVDNLAFYPLLVGPHHSLHHSLHSSASLILLSHLSPSLHPTLLYMERVVVV